MIFKSPLIVGYKGEVGSFILQGLIREMPKATNIWCFDINETEEEKIERINKSDYIFLCVPIQETVNWLIKYKFLLKDKIIVEQCSLKSIIYEDNRINDLNFISMHILFRPSATPNKEDKRCLVLDMFKNKIFVWDLVKIIDSEVSFLSNYKQHDMLMAKKQALVHKVILALDKEIEDGVDTYTSSVIKKLAERIKSGNKELYEFIQSNEFLPINIKKFKDKL
jgi:prephenate dehydrogenase